jgi:ADP-ribose pyrophosphatase YjhB (NUDIX family)
MQKLKTMYYTEDSEFLYLTNEQLNDYYCSNKDGQNENYSENYSENYTNYTNYDTTNTNDTIDTIENINTNTMNKNTNVNTNVNVIEIEDTSVHSVHLQRTDPINMKKMSDKKKYRNVYCVNCGEKGHVVKDCDGPITSFGIIAFKMVYNQEDEMNDKNIHLSNILRDIKEKNRLKEEYSEYPKIKFLMIQRKDTMGYIDFIRGKYPEDNDNEKQRLLNVCLREMIPEEKGNLLKKTFDELWGELWLNKNSKTFKNEYSTAKKKYEQLNVTKLVNESETFFDFQEFSFPKGRRNMKENHISCAEREFFEETGYTKMHYDFIKNYPTITEEFVGTNGIRYRHIYYLVKMKDNIPPPKIDYNNIVQMGEVQNVGWFTYEECISLIRPYDIAKKKCIRKVYNDIIEMNEIFICSNFYYNKSKNIAKTNTQIYDYRKNEFFRSKSF